MNGINAFNNPFSGVQGQRPPGPPPGPPPELQNGQSTEEGQQLPPPPPCGTQNSNPLESLLNQFGSQSFMSQSSGLLNNFLSF